MEKKATELSSLINNAEESAKSIRPRKNVAKKHSHPITLLENVPNTKVTTEEAGNISLGRQKLIAKTSSPPRPIAPTQLQLDSDKLLPCPPSGSPSIISTRHSMVTNGVTDFALTYNGRRSCTPKKFGRDESRQAGN